MAHIPTIHVIPDLLFDVANKIDVQGDMLTSFITRIDNVVDNLLADWKGDAQTKFANSWKEKRDVYRDLTADMFQFSEFLRRYASTMRNIDSSFPIRI